MPGCIVSATTASFRSVEKRRRRATPVMTSTFENVSDIGVRLGLYPRQLERLLEDLVLHGLAVSGRNGVQFRGKREISPSAEQFGIFAEERPRSHEQIGMPAHPI